MAQLEAEYLIQKSSCHLQATLSQRLEAVHKLHFQHDIKLAVRIKENQLIAKLILQIQADYNKWLDAYNITYVLQRDHGINISVGQVYRLMKILQLPRMSTDKPFRNYRYKDAGNCTDHLHQEFDQK